MPTWTGAELARKALKEIGMLDPTEAGEGENIAAALEVGTDMIDAWSLDRLTIPAATRSVYPLTANTQDYTIGEGGDFDQGFPNLIESWAVIPDDTASEPVEKPQGRPLTLSEWQAIRLKSATGAYPTRLYFDDQWADGLGRISVYTIPQGSNVSIVLYDFVAALSSFDEATEYNLRPGYTVAITTNWAIELASSLGRPVDPELKKRAEKYLGLIKRKNIKPQESGCRPEFAVGSRMRGTRFNVRTGGA